MNISIAKHGVKIRVTSSTSRGIELSAFTCLYHGPINGTVPREELIGTWLILAELVKATSTALMIDSVF